VAEGHESRREAPSGERVWGGAITPGKILKSETQFGAF